MSRLQTYWFSVAGAFVLFVARTVASADKSGPEVNNAVSPAKPTTAQSDEPKNTQVVEATSEATRAKLAMRVNLDRFDPNTPLGDVLSCLQELYDLKITFDLPALRTSGIDELWNAPVKLPTMANVPLYRVFELLLNEAGGDRHSIRYRLRRGEIEITTARGDAVIRGTRFDINTSWRSESQATSEMRQKLNLPVDVDGFEPNTPLNDAFGFLSERYGITMLFDSAAFKRIGLPDVGRSKVWLDLQRDVPLATVLQRLLVQVKGVGQRTARFRLRGWDVEIAPSPDSSTHLRFSADGKLLATDSPAGHKGRLLRIWDRSTGRPIQQFSIANMDLIGFAFVLDSRALAILTRSNSNSKECQWALWNVGSGKLEHSRPLAATGRLALAPDGRRVASASPAAWRLHNVDAGEEKHLPGVFAGELDTLAFSPDGTKLLGTDQGSDSSTAVLCAAGFETEPVLRRLNKKHGGEMMPMSSVVLSGDSQLLATVDCLGRLGVWEVISGRRFPQLESPALVRELALSPDGNLLAISTELSPLQTVQICSLTAGKPRCRLRTDQEGLIQSLAFSSDGKTLAACACDGSPIVWDVSDLANDVFRSESLTLTQLKECWDQLSSDDAWRARQAIRMLGAHPEQSVPFLRTRLALFNKAQEPLSSIVERLLKDLDDDQYVRRNQAENFLLRLGNGIEPRLQQELRKPLRSLEVRRRIERIIERLQQEAVPSPELLRELRAIQALERAGTRDAVEVVKALAKGAAEGMQTQAARAALNRLARRITVVP